MFSEKNIWWCIIWAQLPHFTHLSILLHFMSCHPWWISLVYIQTRDIGQKWVVFPLYARYSTLFTTSSSIGSSIQSSLCFFFQCINTWITVLHICLIPLMLSHGCLYNSCCFLLLCIPWSKIQWILSSFWNMVVDFPTVVYLPLARWCG